LEVWLEHAIVKGDMSIRHESLSCHFSFSWLTALREEVV
jgi:hypothetical protein